MFGTSPINDLIEARISAARSLLMAEGDLSVAQVAERLGYNDQYHFIRQFKAANGQSPGQFRKNNHF
jgi:AraC-like DNA-binding protein